MHYVCQFSTIADGCNTALI